MKSLLILLFAGFFVISLIGMAPRAASAYDFGESFNYGNNKDDYLGDGIKAGSFILHPQLTGGEAYNDNIYATQGGKISDEITMITPSATAESDWDNHSLRLSADGDLGRYANHTAEDYNDYNLKSAGRMDLTRGNYLWGGLDFSKAHEWRGTPDDLNNGVKPVVYNETVGAIGFTHDISRLSTTIGAEARRFDYNNTYTIGGTVIDQEARNRMEYGSSIRFDYELIPGYKAFVKGSGNIVSYDDKDLLGNRDSYGFSADIGTAVEITGKVRGEIYTGYLEQNYDNSAFQSVNGLDAGGKLFWSATALTRVEAGLLRSVEETIIPGAYSFIDTNAFIGVKHDLTRNIELNAKLEYNDYKYEGTSRTDDVTGVSIGGKYIIDKNISAGAGYSYQTRNSNVSGDSYDNNVITATLSAGL